MRMHKHTIHHTNAFSVVTFPLLDNEFDNTENDIESDLLYLDHDREWKTSSTNEDGF